MTKFIELHILQNFPPSCLNRDDTNTPKDCEFGGVRRARISSQCLKRAMRRAFPEDLHIEQGSRTKLLLKLLIDDLVAKGKGIEDSKKLVETIIPLVISKMDGDKTKVLLYLGQDEIHAISALIVANWDSLISQTKLEKEHVKEFLKIFKSGTKAADVALFGRMMAEQPEFNQDAACQVAHALSTHAVGMEMDFYTAVDDLQSVESAEGAGAGMMGVIGYNSSCFYRYANITCSQLVHNLKGDKELAVRAIEAFLRASISAIPSAKQNSFAAQNPPSFVMVVLRDSGSPWSLANAFEKPAYPHNGRSLLEDSIEKIASYWGILNAAYGSSGLIAAPFFVIPPDALGSHSVLGSPVNGISALTEVVLSKLELPEGSN